MDKTKEIFELINWIPNFFGTEDADFGLWWSEVSSIIGEKALVGPVLTTIMRNKIKGKAAELFGGEEALVKMSGEAIYKELKGFYESTDNRIARIVHTYSLNQEDKSAVEYARTKLRLIEQNVKDMSEQDKIGFITYGLKDKSLVAGKKIDSAQELVSTLMKLGAAKPNPTINLVNEKSRRSESPRMENRPKIYCPRCEKWAHHYAKNCPSPLKPYIPRANGRSNYGRRGGVFTSRNGRNGGRRTGSLNEVSLDSTDDIGLELNELYLDDNEGNIYEDELNTNQSSD